jgi:hypothetical protein
LLNTALFEHGLVMTASAIGDNLVKSVFEHFGKTKPKLLTRLNAKRCCRVLNCQNISRLVTARKQICGSREGRTKDGNDETNPGVLKMLGMGSDEKNLMDYFKKIKLFRFLFPMNVRSY